MHLFFQPPLQLALEARPADRLGVAVFGAYGSVTAHLLDGTDDASFNAYKVGARVIGYPMPGHTFDGPELGAELVYAHVRNPYSNVAIDPGNDGLGIGPFVGYKLIADFGLTFITQVGFDYVTARSHPYGLQQGTIKVDQNKHFAPLFNLDLGWSF